MKKKETEKTQKDEITLTVSGPPGIGKTTLLNIISKNLQKKHIYYRPSIKSDNILFISFIHGHKCPCSKCIIEKPLAH